LFVIFPHFFAPRRGAQFRSFIVQYYLIYQLVGLNCKGVDQTNQLLKVYILYRPHFKIESPGASSASNVKGSPILTIEIRLAAELAVAVITD